MASLREIIASFTVDMGPAAREIVKGESLVDQFTNKLIELGKGLAAAFAVDAVIDFTHAVLAEADALAKQSTALGVSTAELQGWQHAAALSGSSAEGFTSAFVKFTKNLEDARSGTGPARDALADLGFKLDEAAFKAARPIDVLEQVAGALKGVEDPAKRVNIVMALLGKQGATLLPLFEEGPEGIAKLRAEVGELGASFDDAFLANAQEYNDNVDRLKLGLKGLAIQVIGPLLPEMSNLSQRMVANIKAFVAWFKEGKRVEAVLKGVSIAGVLGLVRAGGALIARMGGLRAAFMMLGRVVLRVAAPLVALEDLLVFLAGGDSLIGRMIDKAFGAGSQDKVRNFVKTTAEGFAAMQRDAATDTEEFRRNWEGALDLIRRDATETFGPVIGGAIVAAADTFFWFVSALGGSWENFKVKFLALLDALMFSFKVVGEDMLYLGAYTAAAFQDAWENALGGIDDAAHVVFGTLADLMAMIPGLEDAANDLRKTAPPRKPGTGENRQAVDEERARRAQALADEADDIDRRLRGRPPRGAQPPGATAPAPPGAPAIAARPVATAQLPPQTVVQGGPVTVTNTANTHVTVPPGTSSETARRVAKGARQGAQAGLDTNALREALVPAPG
jgi:hypothetical protein